MKYAMIVILALFIACSVADAIDRDKPYPGKVIKKDKNTSARLVVSGINMNSSNEQNGVLYKVEAGKNYNQAKSYNGLYGFSGMTLRPIGGQNDRWRIQYAARGRFIEKKEVPAAEIIWPLNRLSDRHLALIKSVMYYNEFGGSYAIYLKVATEEEVISLYNVIQYFFPVEKARSTKRAI